ncbi:MAG TPA: prepilin-type N-terminal cleavage/methylation domain-containing protein [Thermoanaerobaculaceae bacterium]|nr:prepilin-type N-terminal cleavage/methylation domain-containing protein [Thermoanaerobaculaceae bacterium]
MSRSCETGSRGACRGFTLVEVLVVLASLGVILWMVGQLLFPMRQAAERQRLQVEARQAARASLDYLAMELRGTNDMNHATPQLVQGPATFLTYVWKGNNSGTGNTPTCDGTGTMNLGCVQTSFNNVPGNGSNPTLATPGSDVISVAMAQSTTPTGPAKGLSWAGSVNTSTPSSWAFNLGCPDSAANLALFKTMTGWNGTISAPLMLVTSVGDWAFYQITDYQDGLNGTNCSATPPAWCFDATTAASIPCLGVIAQPGANGINAPGQTQALTRPLSLFVSVRFAAFRVCDGWLEQKDGLFDPTADANCPALAAGADFPPYVTKPNWTPLLPNVEDLQFSYLFFDGSIWNGRPGGTIPIGAGVPIAVGGATPPAYDWTEVIAIRVSVTGRSSQAMILGGGKIPAPPPVVEDHDPGVAQTDTYYRSQLSAVALLRNRLAGY